MKLLLVLLTINLTCFGQNHSNSGHTISSNASYSIDKRKDIYGLIHFSKLPTLEELTSKNVNVLNFVNNSTLYVSFNSNLALQSLTNFISFEELNVDYKIQKQVNSFIHSTSKAKMSILIYLPSNFHQMDTDRFIIDNKINVIVNNSLPPFIIAAELDKESLENIAKDKLVSWITEAPSSIKTNKPFHLCLGANTNYGYKAEFATNIISDEKFLAQNQGWDGAGQNCHDLRYHFKNGTPDISGNDERIAVIDAINTWQKYVSVNFTEITTSGQPNCIDISWEPISHGDVDFGPTTLAHAFYNPNGDIHFNETKTWKLSQSTGVGIDLYSIALHELGHSLGLDHSSLSQAVMYAYYDGTAYTGLNQDDIDGIRSIYQYRSADENNWDKIFIGDVTGASSNKEVVLVNTSYVQGAIRVDDLITGNNLSTYNHCGFQGWMDNTDKMFLADANGDGKKDLVLVNTDYSQGAILVIDLTTGFNLSSLNYNAISPSLNGWMDAADNMFIGDVNGDNIEELILVNTSYTGGAIRSINLITGSSISFLNHGINPNYNGWMDSGDKMLIGDMNNDNKTDLILINTSYTGGAVRTVDMITGANIGLISHSISPNFIGWMDATDKVAIVDVNNDGSDELVLVNTNYSGGAVRSLNTITAASVSWLNHGSFSGWMDACDRLFAADANNDGREDLILVNTGYTGGAIRAVDFTNGLNISFLNHGTYGGWMDGTDRMFCEDVNSNGVAELILVNTGYSGGAIRSLSILNGVNLSVINHDGRYIGWMDENSIDQNCNNSAVFKSNELEESHQTFDIAGTKENQNFTVFPNPASNEINIQINNNSDANYSFFISDLNGRRVLDISNLESKINKFDVSFLQSGLYIVHITEGETIEEFKIQIQR